MATKKFKTKMNRLETIVDAMETGDLELEKALKYFEEGMALVDDCHHELDQAEAKVMKLIESDDGQAIFVPFEGEEADDDASI